MRASVRKYTRTHFGEMEHTAQNHSCAWPSSFEHWYDGSCEFYAFYGNDDNINSKLLRNVF